MPAHYLAIFGDSIYYIRDRYVNTAISNIFDIIWHPILHFMFKLMVYLGNFLTLQIRLRKDAESVVYLLLYHIVLLLEHGRAYRTILK